MAVAFLGVRTVQLTVLLPAFPNVLAVLVDPQPVLQLLGPALLLRGRVPLFLLLVQRLKLAFERIITRPGRLARVRHALPPKVGNQCRQAS